MENKNIFKQFEEEYGINLLEPQQTQEPQQPENENLFKKLSRFKHREFNCDLDVVEYKKWIETYNTLRFNLLEALVDPKCIIHN